MEKEQEFIKIIKSNQQRIYKICSVYSSTPEDCEDLVQDVILTIWKAFPSYQQKAAVNTWIYRIILNVCLKKRFQSSKQQRTISLEGLLVEPIAEVPETQDENFLALKGCIAQLDFSDRAIIVLFLEDMAYKEIATIVGISENYVAVKINRIKKKLADCLNRKLS